MRINYNNITIKTLLDLMEILPNYDLICDGDSKEIIIKEKVNIKK